MIKYVDTCLPTSERTHFTSYSWATPAVSASKELLSAKALEAWGAGLSGAWPQQNQRENGQKRAKILEIEGL